jgi:membrane associated rhomboid family serine protease
MSEMREIRLALPKPEKLLTRGVVVILSLMVAGFIGTSLAPDTVLDMLALNSDWVIHGRIWQLVTYPFVSGTYGLLWNGLLVLFVGSAIEREWRTASFLWLWLTVSVVCGILWVLISLLARTPFLGTGAYACCYGIIAVMGLIFRGRRYLIFFTTAEAQHIAIGLIVIGIIFSIPAPIGLVWVTGALVAYVYVKARWSLAQQSSVRPASRRSGGKGSFVDID